MPPLSSVEKSEYIENFNAIADRVTKVTLIEEQKSVYAQRKASGLDNAQKNAAVMANIAVVAAGIIALINADVSLASMALVATSLVFMILAVVISYVMFAPKSKNWKRASRNENTRRTSLKRVQAAANGDDALLEYIYLEAVEGEHHWNYLLLLERREFGLICVLSALGLILSALSLLF
ncbi:MAG TPA: hypothetical protein VLA77_01930 [Candidatus Saccharimonadales bacterium]|nr:hypothetical protein [Candidatus Saccharimonadales bacterium]